MEIAQFTPNDLKGLWKPKADSSGEDNGQVVIIGGSDLFTGAPLLSLTAASRIVDMVFLATPDEDKTVVNKVKLFSKLKSVIWVPRNDVEAYIDKSDAVLIGPGLKRFHQETDPRPEGAGAVYDEAGTYTKSMTAYFLHKKPGKRWIIDGGSLQVMDTKDIPPGAVLTPNNKEFEMLFKIRGAPENVSEMARLHKCVIVLKGAIAYVSDGEKIYEIKGGNAGLTKGGTGDVLAGVITGLAAKNPMLLAAAAGTLLVKKSAEALFEEAGYGFNADDLAGEVFRTWKNLDRSQD